MTDNERARELWASVNEQFTDDHATERWADPTLVWGLFHIPETDIGALGDVAGLDVAELGCGTAFFSAALAVAGARPVGVDLSPHQLASARRCQERFGPTFPLVEADAGHVPLRGRSFDLVVSEYGAGPWCEPSRWLGEAARLLRPGGRLVFLTNSLLAGMCVPADGGFAGDRLLRGQRDLARVDWPGGAVEHHPSHGDWIRMLRDAGFALDALHELYPRDDAVEPPDYEIVTLDWARRWPAEDLWVAHLSE